MALTESNSTVFNHVAVIGLGYIGLPTAAFIASKGIQVTGIDVNEKYVDSINAGEVPFYEPGFDSLLKEVVQTGYLSATKKHVAADAYIVCVPTPFSDNHQVDPTYINSAARSLAPHLSAGALVILESTSPPGTTKMMAELLISLRPDLSMQDGAQNAIFVAHCPERVLPGKIMEEMENNDRVVGGLTPTATLMAEKLYSTFCSGEILKTDATTAEMAKLTENSFRDVNIAFANELSIISDQLDINVWELIEIANHHPRVNILQPGPGVGGHCIAVDPWFIVSSAPNESRLIRTAREVNDSKPDYVIQKALDLVSEKNFKELSLFGLAFKADIDDLRESPSINIVEQLAKELPEVTLKVVEPNISALPKELERFGNIQLVPVTEAISTSDLLVLLVDHKEFKGIDSALLQDKILLDTKGLWN